MANEPKRVLRNICNFMRFCRLFPRKASMRFRGLFPRKVISLKISLNFHFNGIFVLFWTVQWALLARNNNLNMTCVQNFSRSVQNPTSPFLARNPNVSSHLTYHFVVEIASSTTCVKTLNFHLDNILSRN